MNYCVQIGRIVRDPEITTTKEGKKMANITIAVPADVKDQPDNFFYITAFDKLAEFVEKYCVKGKRYSFLTVPRSRNYVDADGNKRYIVNFTAQKIGFVDYKNDSGTATNTQSAPAAPKAAPAPAAPASAEPSTDDTDDFDVFNFDNL